MSLSGFNTSRIIHAIYGCKPQHDYSSRLLSVDILTNRRRVVSFVAPFSTAHAQNQMNPWSSRRSVGFSLRFPGDRITPRVVGQIPLYRLPRDVRDKPVTSPLAQIPLRWLPRTETSPSRRNAICAKGDVTGLSRTRRGRHREVGLVEFGL